MGVLENVDCRRLSMAGCLVDDFFRVVPVAAAIALAHPAAPGQIDRKEAPVAAAALASPAASQGHIDGDKADPEASMPKRLCIAPQPQQALACICFFVLSFSGRAFLIPFFVLWWFCFSR
jgi:hypothetical protein